MTYAASQGATSPVWWLDIENDICGQYWSCNQSLNSETIQGALDFLRSQKLTAGIYSTQVQYQGITGGYVPPARRSPFGSRAPIGPHPPIPPATAIGRLRRWRPTAARSTPSRGHNLALARDARAQQLSLRPRLRLLSLHGARSTQSCATGLFEADPNGGSIRRPTGCCGRLGSRWAASLYRTSHHLAPVKAHSVIEALSGKKRASPPWGEARGSG